ncbi:hypothetical protein Ddye_031545 [Dipteronia dyeriana]|uniref:Leucine-rich repeat-containing N-terminal plant-type domain-containing protein n=1 Tax=Dipteronia dyeriana TaxID=168575 RepID=A0AAD9WNS0_9ROSI|nr:hypothetical protein Ddye_031545 [Dipteronia dyeriana]
MACRNSTFQLVILLLLVLLTKSLFTEAAAWSNNSSSAKTFDRGCIVKEREALLKFKKGLIDLSGQRLSSWVGDDCCNWVGVECSNHTGHVLSLQLSAADYNDESWKLRGTLDPCLLNLTRLNYLDLSYNFFHGTPIPKFISYLKNLRHLDLSQASFTGLVPSTNGNLSNLDNTSVYAASPIPEWFFNITTLRLLRLKKCELSGSISGFPWANRPKLLYLDFSSNKLGGNLPDSLGYLGNLENLQLSDNSIVGPLPTFIGNLSLLEQLDLSSNMINRKIPESVGKIAHMKAISLKNNGIIGPIPLNIGHKMTEMVSLDLSGNLLNGSIPPSMTEMKELIFLDLSSNYLSGAIPPNWHSLKELSYMELSNNSSQEVYLSPSAQCLHLNG